MNIFKLLGKVGHSTKDQSDRDELETKEIAIDNLPYEEARQQAYTILETNRMFSLEASKPDDVLPPELPNGLRELFFHYRTINWIGVAQISLDNWFIFAEAPDCFVIGEDTESSLVIKGGEEPIYIASTGEFTSEFPSVFHWLLVLKESLDTR